MLFEVLMNFILVLAKFLLRVICTLLLLPVGIYLGLNKFFPVFTHSESVGFWIVFGLIIIVCYYILWKPILWISGITTILGAGND